jgi:prepilin-type N-terminal cleavage/methylation domain-containing protein/prepilin-type processing-associated H-X9-DG protein
MFVAVANRDLALRRRKLSNELINFEFSGETEMKPNTSLTGAASRNGTSAGSLAGKHRQAFTLVDRRPWSQRVGGFTLIELLVVIAIVSLLLGLIVHYLDTAKKTAAQVMWRSYLKSAGIAVQMYVNDNDGRFPIVTDLSQVPLKVMEALKPYVNSDEIFWCPDDPEKSKHPGGSIDYRVTHDPKTTLSGVRLDLLRHPSRVIIAGERSAGWHKSGMMNVLYADGHVDQVTEEEWFRNITKPLEFS